MRCIKVFKFLVSNRYYRRTAEHKMDGVRAAAERHGVDNIEETVNRFCKNHTVLDIKVNTVQISHRSMGGGNDDVELYYTIVYDA